MLWLLLWLVVQPTLHVIHAALQNALHVHHAQAAKVCVAANKLALQNALHVIHATAAADNYLSSSSGVSLETPKFLLAEVSSANQLKEAPLCKNMIISGLV